MKITESADWRDSLPFETPKPLADVVPGDPARCAGCGVDAPLRDRSELWVVKHRHPKQHAGFVRFYCELHVPKAPPAPAPVAAAARPGRSAPARAPRTATSRPASSRPAISVERPRALCPNCFVEVPPSGVCGICGTAVG